MLAAANTGAPLTAEGVAALASLRASAKRTGRTVGRFGVGFAAVAAVADEVVVASTTGAVRFSRALTLAAVQGVPALAGELAARDGRVPLLRLPFESDERPRAGFTTEVRVTVSDDAAVRAMLADVDPTLLLVLPGLDALEVGDRVLRAAHDGDDVLLDGVRWRVLSRDGELEPALLAGRPVEEQEQTRWAVTWAVPLVDGLPAALPAGLAPVV
ncbi:MAG: ATP-binding protein, partial [Mycobacteriales bacterium]